MKRNGLERWRRGRKVRKGTKGRREGEKISSMERYENEKNRKFCLI